MANPLFASFHFIYFVWKFGGTENERKGEISPCYMALLKIERNEREWNALFKYRVERKGNEMIMYKYMDIYTKNLRAYHLQLMNM